MSGKVKMMRFRGKNSKPARLEYFDETSRRGAAHGRRLDKL